MGPDKDAPLISVIILTYKRRDALQLTLDSVLQQDYPNREIIVVDNHSEGDTEGFVRSRDPSIRFIGLPHNLGSCAGRNAGIREARGQILVTLDDDVCLASPLELSKIVTTFEQRPRFQVLAFQVCDVNTGKLRLREWCHPRSWKEFGESEFETSFFAEGACAYRHGVFEVCGLYYEPLFIGHEGPELVLRLVDHGFRILYTPRIQVQHLFSHEARTSERPYYFYTRNYIWIAYKNYRLADGLRFLLPKLLMMLYFTVRTASYSAFGRGLRDGVVGLRQIRGDRVPLSGAALRYIASLEKERPGWRSRLARHRFEPQL